MSIQNVLLTLHAVITIVITMRILWRYDLTSSARMAWFILIVALPYLGVLVYWLFGEVNMGKSVIAKRYQIMSSLKSQYPHVMGDEQQANIHISAGYRPAFKFAASVNGFNTTVGNRAILMKNSDDTVKHMLADFDAATDHIHVLYYIWLNDHTGTAIAQALIRAAKHGVTCRAMVDGLGSRQFIKSALWQQLQDAGVQVAIALPLKNLFKTLIFSRIDLRNHRKITIIDGKITYCGSQNCADPEFLVKAKYAPWVDIMLRFEGPVVAQNQLLFASDWLLQHKDTPADAFVYHADNQHTLDTNHLTANAATDAKTHTQSNRSSGFAAQVFADGPSLRRDASPQLFCTLINQALNNLTISTPYFVPDYSLINAICAAAYRGVDVTLIVPKKNDSWVVAFTSRSFYRQLLEAGVQIFEFKDGLLHAKTLTIDGNIAFIGSTNMDLRSFNLNYENNILLSDKATTKAIIQRQQSYIERSERVTLNAVMQWSWFKQITHNVVATIGPVL